MNSVIIILVIVYSSAIDQFKYSHFVCLPVYHHVFQCVRRFARGGGGETQLRGRGELSLGGGEIPGFPPSVSNPGDGREARRN